MFRFFTTRKWVLWAWLGSALILSSLWIQVEIDVKINEWFGEFYDMIQKALATPNAVTIEEYWSSFFSFIYLAGIYVAIAVAVSFFTAHFLFRWRTAMVEWYHSVYDKARTIEGASQRVQEDTIKFSRIMEGLGTSFIESIMVLVQFIPILFGLSVGIPIFFFGDWQYGLITGAIVWSVGGTLFLIGLGWLLSLVGVEYDLQKKANQAKKKQKTVSLKEIKLRPGTETHDYNFKIKNAKKFISKGNKVKFTVKFKGREMQHTDLGKDLMDKIIEETKDVAKVESKPKFEGRQMVMIIQPL